MNPRSVVMYGELRRYIPTYIRPPPCPRISITGRSTSIAAGGIFVRKSPVAQYRSCLAYTTVGFHRPRTGFIEAPVRPRLYAGVDSPSEFAPGHTSGKVAFSWFMILFWHQWHPIRARRTYPTRVTYPLRVIAVRL